MKEKQSTRISRASEEAERVKQTPVVALRSKCCMTKECRPRYAKVISRKDKTRRMGIVLETEENTRSMKRRVLGLLQVGRSDDDAETV